MCEREEPRTEGELKNNNQQGGVLADDNANANDVWMEARVADTGTLFGQMTETAEQDKVVIWGTDSQCDDPELAEFEMLECQELEAYLVEEGEDFVGLSDRKELQAHSLSCSKGTEEAQAINNKSKEDRMSILHGACEQESNACHVSESRDVSKTELSSETDVFVSCLSTISSMATAMDTFGRTHTTDSSHFASGPYSTISEDLTLASQIFSTNSERGKVSQQADHLSHTQHHRDVDMNLNSTVHSADVVSQAQMSNGVFPCSNVIDEHKKNNNQRNKGGNTISEGDQGHIEHSVLPKTKISHKESSTKTDKSTQADDAPDVTYSPPSGGTKGNQSSIESKAIKKQGSFDNALKKQNSFDKTFKKQRSFDNTLKKQASFENTVASNSSSLERRKPWGSPSRPAIPTSPKPTSCSPKRRPPGSPAKVQGIRALSLERSSSPQRSLSQTVKPPGKTLMSGIPKPVMPQQKEPELRRSSPPQKPKNVRPKIITYVRKNPQAKPDPPYEALRLSSYSSPPAHKDPKVGPQPKSSPVLCSSNLLFDKYRQEMQKAGYYPAGTAVTGVKTSSSTIAQKLGGKSDSFHEEEVGNVTFI